MRDTASAGLNKKQIKRPTYNNEIQRWAFGDYENYGDISLLDMNEEDEPGEIKFLKKSPKSSTDEKNGEKEKTEEEEEKPKRPQTGLLKRGNNSMSRLVPGALQKNVTAERKFFKDLLQLSQQRYVNLVSLNFQKKTFINRQAIKGIYPSEPKRPVTSISSYATQNQSINDSVSSAHDFTPTIPRIRSESVNETRSNPNLGRRRSLNVSSSSAKLNSELERIHNIELSELADKFNRKAKKKSLLKLAENDDEADAAVVTIVEEIKEITNNVNNMNKELNLPKESTNILVKEQAIINENTQQNKGKAIKIVEAEPKIKIETIKKRDTITEDTRYQSLLFSMTSVYRPSTAKYNNNENPNERIVRLLRSNTAFIRDNCHLVALQEKKKPNKHSIEENFRLFERAISNII